MVDSGRLCPLHAIVSLSARSLATVHYAIQFTIEQKDQIGFSSFILELQFHSGASQFITVSTLFAWITLAMAKNVAPNKAATKAVSIMILIWSKTVFVRPRKQQQQQQPSTHPFTNRPVIIVAINSELS